MSFCLPVAPGEFDCILDGINIPPQNAGETHDRGEFGIDSTVDGGVALTDHSARSLPGHEFQALNDKAISRQMVLAWA